MCGRLGADDVGVNVSTKPRRRNARLVVTLPIFVGSAIICALQIGIIPTVIVLALTFVVLVGMVRGLTARSLHRLSKPTHEPGLLLAAEAGLDGKAGVLQFFRDSVEWRPRSGAQPTVALQLAEVVEVAVEPVNSILLRACRLAFTMADGHVVKITVTAPSEKVTAALGTQP